MYAQTNLPYSNRIQLVLTPFNGPLTQNGPLGSFDPKRDLEIHVDGVLIPVQTAYFDTVNNRYLLFMLQTFNLQGMIQVVHHMPSPPFTAMTSDSPPIPVMMSGFAILASFSTLGDP